MVSGIVHRVTMGRGTLYVSASFLHGSGVTGSSRFAASGRTSTAGIAIVTTVAGVKKGAMTAGTTADQIAGMARDVIDRRTAVIMNYE